MLYSCNEGEKHSFIDDSRFVQVDSEIVVNQRLFSELTAKNGLNSKSYNGEVLDGEIWNVVVNSFFIVQTGDMTAIQDYFKKFGMNDTETKDFILGKIFLFESYDMIQTKSSQEPPTLEEIRNAMLEECENGYIEPVTSACKLAVKIAYYYKKLTTSSAQLEKQ